MIVIQNLTPGESKWGDAYFKKGYRIQTLYTKSEAETMGDTLRQLLEGYPGHVGPGMDRRAKQLMIEASAMLNNIQKRLPPVSYNATEKNYSTDARFIDPDNGKSGRFHFSVSPSQLLGTLLPSLPPSFRRASNAEDVIPASVKDPELMARHKEAFEAAHLILAEIDGALIRKSHSKAILSSIQSKYFSGVRSIGGASCKST
jgi:hypothetical protein